MLIKSQIKINSSLIVFFLLFGMFFGPFQAQAGFFSDIFGNQVSADTQIPENDQNSQNMVLLQANVSSAVISEEKKDSKTKEIDINNANIVSENALLPITGPLGVSDGSVVDNYFDNQEPSIYVVKKGDTVALVAEMFDVSTNTVRWANDLTVGEKLKEGDVLIILPITGIEYTVKKGDSFESISKAFKADADEIAQYNGITKLITGDKIIIPNAEITETSSKPTQKTNSNNKGYTRTPIQNIPGYFINPVPNYSRRSQGLHNGKAVDLAAPTGTKVVASASGIILAARSSSYNGGYGKMVIIQHLNDTKTLYAHLSSVAVHVGEKVSQGQTIGSVGSTGHSTGPHLHFEVYGAKNPGATTPMSWAP